MQIIKTMYDSRILSALSVDQQLTNGLIKSKISAGSCPRVLRVSAVYRYPSFCLLLDTRNIMGDLKGKFGSACEEFEENGGILC